MSFRQHWAVAVIIWSGSMLLAQPGHAQQSAELPPHIELPTEFDRVLRDYEAGWQARDAAAMAALFSEDGFVLRPGHPPARGRAAIEEAYSGSGGPLSLRAYHYTSDGSVGYIIGGFAPSEDGADIGKFVLALEKGPNGRWLIAADMDNGN